MGPEGAESKEQLLDPGRELGGEGRLAGLCLWVERHSQAAIRSREGARSKYPSFPPRSSLLPVPLGKRALRHMAEVIAPRQRAGWRREEGGPGAAGGNPPPEVCGETDHFPAWRLSHRRF